MSEYESQEDYRTSKNLNRSMVMSDDEIYCINQYISLLNENKGMMQKLYTRWEEEEKYYGNDIDLKEKHPNSRVNMVCATIEGLVTQIVNPSWSVVCKGVSPEDDEFAEWGQISLEWALKHNKVAKKMSVHEKRRELFGASWIKLVWDEDFAGHGLPKIMTPGLNKIFVDTKIKDYLRLEEAEYICETINLSRTFAENRYGENKANLIDYGYNQYKDNGVFQEEDIAADDNGFTLIQWWSKCEGFLRLQEFSGCGILLYDSFKSDPIVMQDKFSEIVPKPYYKYTNDYPYFLTIKYFAEGELFGFGDGKLLLPLQRMLNEVYDKLRIQMRPNLNLVDVDTNINIDDFDDEDSFNPVPFTGKMVKGNPVWSIPWGQIGNDFWRLIEGVHTEIQKVARFSDIMTGQGSSTSTATEAAIQQSQGNTHSEHEKIFIEDTLSDVCQYMLKMMLEKFKGGKAFRLPGEMKQYEWVDFDKMTRVAALKPASSSYKSKFKAFNPDKPMPQWEHVQNEDGSATTKSVELDIDVSVGSGLPKNKAFLWQMIDSLCQKLVLDDQGQQKPLVTYKEARNFIIKYLGIPLDLANELDQFLAQYQNQGSTPSQNNSSPDMNLPISNSFNPELAQPGATSPQIIGQAQESTEGMSQAGVGQELNNGIRQGG